MREYLIPIDVDASGDATDTSETPIKGRLYALDIVDGTLADNFDMTITYTSQQGVSKTLFTLTNGSVDITYYPREQVHGNTGTALTLDGTQIAFDMPLIAGTVTVVTAQGGVSKSGAVILYVL